MLQRGTLVAFAVALALALALVWLLRTEPVAPPAGPTGPASPAVSPAAARAEPAGVPAVRDAPAPPAVAVPAAELGRDELSSLQTLLAAGQLEALVVNGRQPLGGVPVRVWRWSPSGADAVGDRGPPVREGRTDASGRVRFVGLDAGSLVARAEHGGRYVEATAQVFAGSDPLATARTVLLPFGTARITGTVRDEQGMPRAGLRVVLWRTQVQCSVAAVTDANGAYAFDGLYGGRWHVRLEQASDKWSAANERTLTLATGERARMDFGGLQPAGSWRGRVVDADGGVVGGERALRVRHAVHNDERRLRTDERGEFCIALPPGRWELLAGDWDGAVLTAADVDRGETHADVVWPGIRLVAVVDAPAGVDAAELKGCLTLTPDGAACLQPDAAFVADGKTLVQWLGVPAGSGLLQIGNGLYFADAPNTGIQVHVSSARVQRVIVNVRRKE